MRSNVQEGTKVVVVQNVRGSIRIISGEITGIGGANLAGVHSEMASIQLNSDGEETEEIEMHLTDPRLLSIQEARRLQQKGDCRAWFSEIYSPSIADVISKMLDDIDFEKEFANSACFQD